MTYLRWIPSDSYNVPTTRGALRHKISLKTTEPETLGRSSEVKLVHRGVAVRYMSSLSSLLIVTTLKEVSLLNYGILESGERAVRVSIST